MHVKEKIIDIKNKYKDIKSAKFLNTNSFNSNLSIVFICQCQHIWDKEKFLVENLIKNNKINITLYICEDNGIIDDTVFERFALVNKVNFVKHKNGLLRSLNPNIIFYSRPYDLYLPEEIRTCNTKEFATLAYIPYGYSLMKIGQTNLNRAFTENISLFFSECEYSTEFFSKQHKRNVKKGYQKVYSLGYPFLEDLIKNKNDYLNSEDLFASFSNDKLNVIWTPRWTQDDKLGGSNLLRYIDFLFDCFIDNEKYNFVFRPHPYALKEFVEQGIITEEKKNEYLGKLRNSNNAIYDNKNDYLSTFNHCDVLITDISSIIAEFMAISDKPIIFCHNEKNEVLNDFCLDCCEQVFYNAYSEDDIKKILFDLENGIDKKKESRIEFNNKFRNSFDNSCHRIEEKLLEFVKEK